MGCKMKWLLISEDDVERVKAGLEHAIEETDNRCAVYGCVCTNTAYHGPKCSRVQRDALHCLETNCHETDALPRDYEDEKDSRNNAIKALFVLLRYILHSGTRKEELNEA